MTQHGLADVVVVVATKTTSARPGRVRHGGNCIWIAKVDINCLDCIWIAKVTSNALAVASLPSKHL